MTMKRSLILTLLLTLAFVVGARNYVLLVGIADYPGTESDLKLSRQDAVTLKTVYDKNGDSVTEILTDAQATVSNVRVSMGNLFARATEDDAVILFFSGHGVPGGFVCYNGLLRYDDIMGVMKQSVARTKMVLADACYAGKARKGKKRSQAPTDQSVLFFLSSRTDEQSQERLSWHNSLFTAYVERGLRGGADTNFDRTITARELFDFVSQGVAMDSQQRQHPVMWGKFDDDMPLMVWKKTNNHGE